MKFIAAVLGVMILLYLIGVIGISVMEELWVTDKSKFQLKSFIKKLFERIKRNL